MKNEKQIIAISENVKIQCLSNDLVRRFLNTKEDDYERKFLTSGYRYDQTRRILAKVTRLKKQGAGKSTRLLRKATRGGQGRSFWVRQPGTKTSRQLLGSRTLRSREGAGATELKGSR